jgi:hypothetical protein
LADHDWATVRREVPIRVLSHAGGQRFSIITAKPASSAMMAWVAEGGRAADDRRICFDILVSLNRRNKPP